MTREIELTDDQINEKKGMVTSIRKNFGVYPDVPIANEIVPLIEGKGIVICEYPFKSERESHTDATITWFETNCRVYTFIGLNTSLYYDEQVFALTHELYHYETRTGKAYKDVDIEDKVTELMADRYAAELLLPECILVEKVKKE